MSCTVVSVSTGALASWRSMDRKILGAPRLTFPRQIISTQIKPRWRIPKLQLRSMSRLNSLLKNYFEIKRIGAKWQQGMVYQAAISSYYRAIVFSISEFANAAHSSGGITLSNVFGSNQLLDSLDFWVIRSLPPRN